MRHAHWFVITAAILAPTPAFGQETVPVDAAPEPEVITVFDEAELAYNPEPEQPVKRDGLTVLAKGQVLERQVELPALPANQRDARRIIATMVVEPVLTEVAGRRRPGDPWTRLGSLTMLADPAQAGEEEALEVELLRFATGFGGTGTFEQDVTPLAPLLSGPTVLRAFISTYMNPGWKVTVTLTYDFEGVGFRRPVFVEGVFFEEAVTADAGRLEASVEIPEGLAQPRVRILSTGHSSDGQPGDEFISRTHILRIDGEEVARFRPWREEGGPLRSGSPTSGRMTIDGRLLWSSDLDRAGWHPGALVRAELVPVPELTPGEHEVELEILDIRPTDSRGGYGYWRTSLAIMADEPWPWEGGE